MTDNLAKSMGCAREDTCAALEAFDCGGQRLVRPPIRGRACELKAIRAHVSAAIQGSGAVLIVEGPPGIGKSRLLAEVVAVAEHAGARALLGESFEYQQAVPFFSLFMATLRAHPPVGDAEALRRLGDSVDLQYWVVHDLANAICAAASETPLAIVLEDIHWADAGTLLALRSLTVRVDARVLWVLSARTGSGGPAVRETLDVLERRGAVFLRLNALSASAVADIVLDIVRAKADTSLLNLAAKAHGNPFLVKELLSGLDEEGRLDVSRGRATATGRGLPRRLAVGMQLRLDLLSHAAGEVVRVAAVLPDRFSVGLLAAMLERQPASLMSAVGEAVRADLLAEDGAKLRFRHDLLREAVRQVLPKSLRRAMERQSALMLLELGAAPAEVATQLARSAEPGDQAAIVALRKAARSVGNTDASAAADLSKRALDLLSADDVQRGQLVAETVVLLNRAGRHADAQALATVALSEASSAEEEAAVRLRVAGVTTHTTQRRVEENRRALQLSGLSEVTRARHLAWLAYHLMHDQSVPDYVAANEAAVAAASTGDVEAHTMAEVTLACLDCGNGYASRAIARLESLCALTRMAPVASTHDRARHNYANMLAVVGRLDDAAAQVADSVQRCRRQGNAMALHILFVVDGSIQLAAGRLAAARGATESLTLRNSTEATEIDMLRMVVLAEVARRTGDRKLLHEMVKQARDAHPAGSAAVRRGTAHVLALAAWQRGDVHEAMRWISGISLFEAPLWPQALDLLVLSSQIASAAGDAGLRAAALRICDVLERERPAFPPLFEAVAGYVRGMIERDARALTTAAASLQTLSRPVLYASAAEDAAGELAHIGRSVEALDQFNAAFDTYTACGATADALRVGRRLRTLGVQRRIVTHPRAKTGWESLTDSELKVINLIAQGATNNSVAQRLRLSPHTVKAHLRKAFVKLEINSRGELRQMLGGASQLGA
ncbi:LuxR family transcriptional regulator [Mycobacterium simiae]